MAQPAIIVYSSTDVDFVPMLDTANTFTAAQTITPTADTTSIFQVNQADTTTVFNVDTTNGRVGVGTDTPARELDVSGNTSTLGLSIADSNSLWFGGWGGRPNLYAISNVLYIKDNDANVAFTLDTTGNVGIGQTAPSAKLHVIGDADDQQLIVQANATQTANIVEYQKSDGTVLGAMQGRGTYVCTMGTDVSNLFLGWSGTASSSGTNNITIGYLAGIGLTSATGNVVIGKEATRRNTIGGATVAIGTQAGYNNITGANNVWIGHQAGYGGASLSNTGNTGLGYQAGFSIATSGNYNFFLGYRSGYSLTTGDSNIFIGKESGYRQTTNSNRFILDNQIRADVATELTNSILYGVMAAAPANQTLRVNSLLGVGVTPTAQLHVVGQADIIQTQIVANSSQTANLLEIQKSDATVVSGFDERGILFSFGGVSASCFFAGNNAGNVAVTGAGNVGIGQDSLIALSSGSANFGLGTDALRSITTGANCVAIGTNALRSIVGGSDCIGIGEGALYDITGVQNVAIGRRTGYENVSGTDNVYIGNYAGTGVSGNSHSRNTFIGKESGKGVTTGSDNLMLGHEAGFSITSGGSNVFVGQQSGYRQTTNSNLLIIDNQLRADVATELTNSILYGVMAAAPADQTLRINVANLTVAGGDTVDPRITFDAGNDGYIEWQEDEVQFHIEGGVETSGGLVVGGSFFPKAVDDDAMDATDGVEGEIVYNQDDNKFYGCTTTGTPATWEALN